MFCVSAHQSCFNALVRSNSFSYAFPFLETNLLLICLVSCPTISLSCKVTLRNLSPLWVSPGLPHLFPRDISHRQAALINTLRPATWHRGCPHPKALSLSCTARGRVSRAADRHFTTRRASYLFLCRQGVISS